MGTDHSSYLSRHRPICTVIEEIKEKVARVKWELVEFTLEQELEQVIKLCDEAKDYAQRMSNRLMEYKRAQYHVMYGMKGEKKDGDAS